MGIVDKAKEMLAGHTEQAEQGVDKAAQKANDMTGKKYGDKIDRGANVAKDRLGSKGEKGREQSGS